MLTNFYSFDIDYEPQLKTNWCWCACFSWISKSLQLNTEYKEQYQFQSYYRNHFLKTQDLTANEVIGDNYLLDTTADHVDRLIQETLQMDFSLMDLMVINRDKKELLTDIFDYNHVSNYLFINKAPWLIATDYHMFLISGFGFDRFRNYILVSDPNIIENEKFVPIETFVENYGYRIRKIWQLTHKTSPEVNENHQEKILFENTAFKVPTKPEHFDTYILKRDVENIQSIEAGLRIEVSTKLVEHIT